MERHDYLIGCNRYKLASPPLNYGIKVAKKSLKNHAFNFFYCLRDLNQLA